MGRQQKFITYCGSKDYVSQCRSTAVSRLKGKGVHSGIRVTYAYFSVEGRIEFIEIYYKGDQENEDRERIKKYQN
jgi:hypothetical protein